MAEYEPNVQAEYIKRSTARDEAQAKASAEYKARMERERNTFEEKVKGITIELSDEALWNDLVQTNSTDAYSKCCVDYAEGWAKLMQVEIATGKTVVECANSVTSYLDFMGITGYMYGAAVSMLAKCWKHGEELRKWHNKEYNHEGDGVVNPAILTLSRT